MSRARLRTVALVVAGLVLVPAAARAEEPLPPQGTPPPGANDYSCKPPPRHPYPVILVHGTLGNQSVLLDRASTSLERLGYCVFALDYGVSVTPGSYGRGEISKSARQLSTFVNLVLSKTGATKVSIIGHSQGGMMPRYLIKFLGGARKVDDLVGFSPSNHGTDSPGAYPVGLADCEACIQQIKGSDFLNNLNAGDQTPPPVSYTVLETSHDEVVTPYQSEFLPLTADGRVTNILLQDKCPDDQVDHVFFPEDAVAIQWALNAVGRPGPADPNFKVDCSGKLLDNFPDSSSVAADKAKVRLRFGKLPSHAGMSGRLRVVVRAAGEQVSKLRLVVHALYKDGPVRGASKHYSVTERKRVGIALRGRLGAGRYVLVAMGRDSSGGRVRAVRAFKLR